MRRMALAALLLPGLLVLAACEGRETSRPLEPSFGKVATCTIQPALQQEIYDRIEALFTDRNARNAAHEHIANIVQELCEDPPDYDGARQHLNSFIQQVAGQPDDKLAQDSQAWDELVNLAILLATEIPFEIPEGAFLSSGGLGIVDPSLETGDALTTRNGQAEVYVQHLGNGVPIIMALSLLDGDLNFGDYEVVPPAYDVLVDADRLPDGALNAGAVLVQMCVEDNGRLQIGHLDEETGEVTLLDRVTEGLTIECGTSTALAPGTGLLGRLARLAGSAARKIFGPEPLYARYFAASGLGGRPISFSPFAPVDPSHVLTVHLQDLTRGNLVLTDDQGDECGVGEDEVKTCVWNVPGGELTLTASILDGSGGPWDLWPTGVCDEPEYQGKGAGQVSCTISMTEDKEVSFKLTQ